MSGTPLDAGQVAALRDERSRIAAYLSVVPAAQMTHPSVGRARERMAQIDAALVASDQRAAKLTKKMRRAIPQLIDQVAGVDPVVAGHMKALMKGDATAKDALLAFAMQRAGSTNPQLAALVPLVASMFDQED